MPHRPIRFEAEKTSNLDDALRSLSSRHTLHNLQRATDVTQARESVTPPTQKESAAFDIRPMRTAHDLINIYRLVHDAYVERGYIEPRSDGQLVLYPHLDHIPETTVLIAEQDGQIVGTNSLTVDSPRGLPSDEDFKKECDNIRAERRKLAGSWRLCTRTGFRDERSIVMELIARTVQMTLENKIETCVFTVHPRHARVYEKLLNMQTVVRREQTVKGLQNAPAVFMRCDYENLPAWCQP